MTGIVYRYTDYISFDNLQVFFLIPGIKFQKLPMKLFNSELSETKDQRMTNLYIYAFPK